MIYIYRFIFLCICDICITSYIYIYIYIYIHTHTHTHTHTHIWWYIDIYHQKIYWVKNHPLFHRSGVGIWGWGHRVWVLLASVELVHMSAESCQFGWVLAAELVSASPGFDSSLSQSWSRGSGGFMSGNTEVYVSWGLSSWLAPARLKHSTGQSKSQGQWTFNKP